MPQNADNRCEFFIGSPSDEIRQAKAAGKSPPRDFFCQRPGCGGSWAAHYGGMNLAEDKASKARK